jgi:AcrR family transcriptional regulator
MSLEQLRENNKKLVTEKALECFIENGIEKTKVSDIARRSGLTERSIFRYFATKTDIVIAASFLYWEKAEKYTREALEKERRADLTGIEQIRVILYAYSSLLLADPRGIRFSLDAEVALYNAGKYHEVVNRPPEKYETYTGPLAQALRVGIADGTVDPKADVKTLYYNSYDSILGMMQRLTVGVPSVTELETAPRLKAICDMYVNGFAAKK